MSRLLWNLNQIFHVTNGFTCFILLCYGSATLFFSLQVIVPLSGLFCDLPESTFSSVILTVTSYWPLYFHTWHRITHVSWCYFRWQWFRFLLICCPNDLRYDTSLSLLLLALLFAADDNKISTIWIKWIFFKLKCVTFPFVVSFFRETCAPPTLPYVRRPLVRTKESDSRYIPYYWYDILLFSVDVFSFTLIIFLSQEYAAQFVLNPEFCLIYFHFCLN